MGCKACASGCREASGLSSAPPMKILFATGHGYLPQRVGGSETSSHELILALQEQGHRCAVLSALQGNGWLAFRNRVAMKLTRRPLIGDRRSEEHTSELQSLMRISYAVFCLQ